MKDHGQYDYINWFIVTSIIVRPNFRIIIRTTGNVKTNRVAQLRFKNSLLI